MKRVMFIIVCLAGIVTAQEVRQHQVSFNVTEAEAKALFNAAAEAHLDLGDFVRMKVMEGVEIPGPKPVAKKAAAKPKGKELIPGWTVSSGKWLKIRGGVCSEGGSLQWGGSITKDQVVEVSFTLTARKWNMTSRHQNVSVLWNSRHPDVPRNFMAFRSDAISIMSQPPRPDVAPHKTAYTLPLGKPVKVKIKISRKGIIMSAGRTIVKAAIPAERMGALQLHTNGVNAIFSNVKVKVE